MQKQFRDQVLDFNENLPDSAVAVSNRGFHKLDEIGNNANIDTRGFTK